MTKLAEIQSQLQDYLLGKESGIEAAIALPPQGDRAERLGIYGHTYYKRLIGVLEQSFRGLRALMGKEAFADMAYEYIKANPSRYFSVDNIGIHLAEFLTQHQNYAKEPIYAEMAVFERTMTMCYDAEDVSLLTSADIGAIAQNDWPKMHLGLAPNVNLLQFHWNTTDIYDAIMQDQKLPEAQHYEQPLHCVIWRYEYTPYYYLAPNQEASCLQLIANGKSFLDICEALCELLPDDQVTPTVVDYILQWLNKGMLATVEIRK